MSQEPLNLGFIGGGINSAVGNTHKIASQMDGRWKLVAGCFSTHAEINIKTANIWNVEEGRTYSDWNEFLLGEQGKLDAICILTPTNKHTSISLKALELGYNIISEKTISTNYSDAIKISESLEKGKQFFAAIYNYTGYPMLRELRNMIFDEEFGCLYQINIEMPQEGFARYYDDGKLPNPQEWRLNDYAIPTISLDLGIHLHHLAYFLSGEKPLEVIADQRSYGHFKNVIDDVACIARYSSDLRSQIWYSKSALGHRNGLKVRVYGKNISAEWYQMDPEILKLSYSDGSNKILDRASRVKVSNLDRYNRFKSGHPAGFIEAFANHYFDIADALIEFEEKGYYKSDFVFGESIATEGLKMLDAINLSSRTNRWEKIKYSLK